MNEKERMKKGLLYNPFKVNDNQWYKIRPLCKKFNESYFWKDRSALDKLLACFGKAHEDSILTAPFYCDKGYNIYLGKRFYANTNLTILDEGKVSFGDNIFIGPNVSIYTVGHPINKDIRNTNVECAKAINIGSDVWIGGNVVINPGANIGDDVVIGSGSVVTKDIPSHSLACGNPCKVIRKIDEEDKIYWQNLYEDYCEDINKNE